MKERLSWIETTGGPHILVALENRAEWHGIDGWTDNGPADHSDYARACRGSDRWLNAIPIAGGEAIVFGGDVGPVAWLPDPVGGGVFIQWLGCDGEAAILDLLQDDAALKASTRPEVETQEFRTGPSGILTLFDATLSGDEAESETATVAIRPGRYRLKASSVESEHVGIVLRSLTPLCS